MNMTKVLPIAMLALMLVSIPASPLEAQTTPTSTTITGNITGNSSTGTLNTVCFASATGISAPGFGTTAITGALIGREFMTVAATTSNSLCFVMQRAQGGTATAAHNSGDTAIVGPTGGGEVGGIQNSPFKDVAPPGGSGSPCNATNESYLPIYIVGSVGRNYQNGQVWNCFNAGAQATGTGNWYPTNAPEIGPALTDFEIFVPASGMNCVGVAVTGSGGSGNNTYILDGAVPALKVDSTAGAATITANCNLTAAMRLLAGRGITLTSIGVVYGVQTTTATSMLTPTISLFNAPVASTSETASSATLVTTTGLVGGTLTFTPALASANLTSVSAGQYYTENIALGTPITMNSDLRTYVFTFGLGQTASAIQIMTVPGIWLRGTYIPF